MIKAIGWDIDFIQQIGGKTPPAFSCLQTDNKSVFMLSCEIMIVFCDLSRDECEGLLLTAEMQKALNQVEGHSVCETSPLISGGSVTAVQIICDAV